MKHFGEAVSGAVMARVTAARKANDMTAADLAAACTAAGVEMPRNVVANLESGRRATLTVAELVAFSQVLGVPLLELLVGVDALDAPSPLSVPPGSDKTGAALLLEAQGMADRVSAGPGRSTLEVFRRYVEEERELVDQAENLAAVETLESSDDITRALLEVTVMRVASHASAARWNLVSRGLRPPLLRPDARAAFIVGGQQAALEQIERGPVPAAGAERKARVDAFSAAWDEARAAIAERWASVRTED